MSNIHFIVLVSLPHMLYKKNLERLFWAPKLRKEDKEEGRKATRLELYFDLFFVASIGLIAHTFAHHLWDHWSWTIFYQLVIQVTTVRRLWSSITYFFERFECTGLTKRIFFFVMMFLIGWMSLSIADWLQVMWMRFFWFYWIAKFLLGCMYMRALKDAEHKFKTVDKLNAVSNFIAAWWALLGFFVPTVLRPIVFVWSMIVDLVLPLFHWKHAASLPSVATEKFSERFGLFVIIVLGEAIVAVVSGINLQTISSDMLRVAGWGLVLNFGHRWLYFDFVSRSKLKEELVYLWAYLHLPLVIAYTIIGALMVTILQNLDTWVQLPITILTITAMSIMILIAILEKVVWESHFIIKSSTSVTTQLLLPVLGMWALLIDWWLSPSAHIWILSWLIFIPIFWKIIDFVTSPIEEKNI